MFGRVLLLVSTFILVYCKEFTTKHHGINQVSKTSLHRSEVSVRLVGGPSENSGRVEIQYQGAWRTVCDDGWDHYAADILCRQLGLYSGWPVGMAYFGKGTGDILGDDMECDGSETSIFDCPQSPPEINDCTHDEDAGVICEGDALLMTTDGDLRLVGPSPREGVVEILHAGRWGKVCSDTWGQKETKVACEQLNFRGGTAIHNAIIPQLNPQTWLTDVKCLGQETRLDWCQHGAWAGQCDDPSRVAYVTCDDWLAEGVTIEDVRLSGGHPWRGRAEVLVAGKWGTICDDGFDNNAADVFCKMLGYPIGYAIGGATYGLGSGDIWLDNIKCSGREDSLNECEHDQWGKTDCTHNEDVGVWCKRETRI